jgi:CBS domain-containing protein
MQVGEACNRNVIIVDRRESVHEATRLMREHHVGDVVVVQTQGAGPVPVGILTDRDIVVELLAPGVDLAQVNIGDVMSPELVTCTDGEELDEAIKRMRAQGVRRMPVTDAAGLLVGILAVDDLLELVTEQLGDLVAVIGREQSRERQTRA